MLITCLPAITSRAFAAPQSVSWETIVDDLEVTAVSLPFGALFDSNLLILRTALHNFRLEVVRAQDYGPKRNTVKNIVRHSKAVAGLNGNFFDENGDPLGLIINRGITHKSVHRGGHALTGILQVTRGGASIINRADFRGDNILEALQAGPRILVAGQKVPGLRDTTTLSKRSGVCLDRDGRLLMFSGPTGLGGISLEELQQILVITNIACRDALNFDGGGSAQFYIDTATLNKMISKSTRTLSEHHKVLEVSGDDTVPVMLGLFVK